MEYIFSFVFRFTWFVWLLEAYVRPIFFQFVISWSLEYPKK